MPSSSCTSPATIPSGCAASSSRKICKRGSAPSAENRKALRVTKAGSGFLIFRLLQKYGRYAISSFYSFSPWNALPFPRILLSALRPWKPRQFALTAFGSHGILFVFGALMKLYSFCLSVLLTSVLALNTHAQAQTPAKLAGDTPSPQE